MNSNRINHLFVRNLIHYSSVRRKTSGKSSAEYCLDLVKQYDYDNFMCSLLLKNSARACAFAVRSFNVEIARIAEQVSQPQTGLMRMTFWEETLEMCYSKDPKLVPKNPVAVELFKAVNNSKLTKRYLKNLIAARKDNFNLQFFKNLKDLEKYAEQSVSNVYYLILEGCDVKNVHADHAASHLGKAQGIVQQLRSIPVARKINFIPVPQDMLIKNKLSQEDILRGRKLEQLSDCTFEIATRAYQHIQKARDLAKNVPEKGKVALLPAIQVNNYLEKLQKCNYNVFESSLQTRSWRTLPQLWFANLRNTY